MHCVLRSWGLIIVAAALSGAASGVRADALSAVQVLREGGCGGVLPRARPLRHDVLLDRAAEQWARGGTLASAATSIGLPAQSLTGVHIRGPDSADIQLLRHASCGEVMDRSLTAIGAYRLGLQTWIVLYPARTSVRMQAQAQPASPEQSAAAGSLGEVLNGSASGRLPLPAQPRSHSATPAVRTAPAPAALAPRALQLVNEVRARGTRCGDRSFAPVGPVSLSPTLTGVASQHALDMAEHNYFEHVDLAGQSPADRVRSVGYREKLVGENIAYGPETVDEVVQGWLDSPGHCENIMDPRFVQMGIAAAPGRSSRRGLYWVQVLAEPRA
jgi:uncharacterized protein YkwD